MFLRNRQQDPRVLQTAGCFLAGLIIGLATAKKLRRGEFEMQDLFHYPFLVVIVLKLNGNLPQQMKAGLGMVMGIAAGHALSYYASESYISTPTLKLR